MLQAVVRHENLNMTSFLKFCGLCLMLANLQPLAAHAERQNIYDFIGSSHVELQALIEDSGGKCSKIPEKKITASRMKNGLTRVPKVGSTINYPWPTLQCKVFGWKLFAAYDKASQTIVLLDIEYEDDTHAIELLYKDHIKVLEAEDPLLLEGKNYKVFIPSGRNDFTKHLPISCGRRDNSWDFSSDYMPRKEHVKTKNYYCLSSTSIRDDVYVTRRFFISDGIFRKRVIHKGTLSIGSKQVAKDLAMMRGKVLEEISIASEKEKTHWQQREQKSEALRELLSLD